MYDSYIGILKKYFYQSNHIIDNKVSFINFWNIRKNTNWLLDWFICSSIIFTKWTKFSFFEICYEVFLSYRVINAFVYKLGKEIEARRFERERERERGRERERDEASWNQKKVNIKVITLHMVNQIVKKLK